MSTEDAGIETTSIETTSTERWTSRMVRIVTRGPAAVFLLVVGAAWLIPAVGLLVSSFRTGSANSSSGWWNALANPSQFTLENYRNMLEHSGVLGALWNTVLITVPVCILVVFIASMAAYAFAWMRFPGRDGLFLVVVGLLVVPLQVALIPVASLFGRIGLFGTIPGVILFHTAFGLPFAIFLLRNFFIGIPRDLLEAARMDGAGEFRVFTRVILPLGTPAIASLLIFQFVWVWNDLLVAMVFARTSSAPLTVFVRDQLRQFGSNIDVIAPGAFLQMVIPLIVFFAFQRYFVQGLLAGSVK
ncbi:MAG: carbohydrate ABC transporter permease [Thermoleophilia bacterium]